MSSDKFFRFFLKLVKLLGIDLIHFFKQFIDYMEGFLDE